ncbi:MAG TPA: TlpA disulfide reductase family protein [Saprospiraceae bacterium]|nr:TlpA disulfide reductase family protein [Saprospiraceae bacterium]
MLGFFLINGFGQSFRTVKLNEIKDLIESKNDSLYIINFWATWCLPCVKEIPYFEELGKKYKNQKLNIILVNLDFKKDIDSKLVPFLEIQKLKSTIWFLDESNPNSFIPKIEENWSGAIPFTLFIKGSSGIKRWHEGSFNLNSLDDQISNILLNH